MSAFSLPFGYSLLDPWFLLLLPLALLAGLLRARTRRAALPTAAIGLFDGVGRTLRQRLAFLPLAGKLLAAVCLTVAMARPVERSVVPMRQQGIDILLVVDISSSMLERDMEASEKVRRIDVARTRAEEFASARVLDRVGLLAFAHYAELRCPPTLDERALAAFLRVLETVEQGSEFDRTAIGTALAKAVQVLQKSDAKSKVVVLLSDGANNVEDILPEEGAKLAKDAGVKVHTIGLGNGVATPFGYQRLDFRDLREIATATGGEFFQPRSDADLATVYGRIDELEKSELSDPRYRTVDRFEWPLGLGLAFLVLALLLEAICFRRVP